MAWLAKTAADILTSCSVAGSAGTTRLGEQARSARDAVRGGATSASAAATVAGQTVRSRAVPPRGLQTVSACASLIEVGQRGRGVAREALVCAHPTASLAGRLALFTDSSIHQLSI